MRSVMQRHNLSARRWAEQAGLGKDTVSRAIRDDYDNVTSTRTIIKLAEAIGEQQPILGRTHSPDRPELQGEDTFDRLLATVVARRVGDPASSYVAKLTAKGRAKIAQKLGEEAVETVIAAMGDDRAALVGEATDLVFHLAIMLADAGLSFDDLRAELVRREGVSGLAEKAARKG